MRVDDLERTVRFYEQALGLRCTERSTSPRGARLAFLSTPNSDEEIEICHNWLRSKGNSIEGGTSEIQANIVAKQVLGLPD